MSNKVIIGDATLIEGDCIEEIKTIESESIDFTVFSPPFPEVYCYSNSHRDLGNCKSYEEFKAHFSFLPPELFRIMKQGRNVAIHCMDTPIQKGKHGFIGLRDFSGLLLRAMCGITEDERLLIDEVRGILSHCQLIGRVQDELTFKAMSNWIKEKELQMAGWAGFIYHSRITIWKNPVTEMQRTKALGLLHKQIKKDSTMSRVGIPDYVLVFRKDGDRSDPVRCEISVDTWQDYASPVWMDIDYGDTLNAAAGRDEKDEKHICPLQLPTIKRLVTLYTNKGDTVFTPFMGIGSEIYQSVKMGRKGKGIELKKSYFNTAAQNIKNAVENNKQAFLFDLLTA